MNFSAEHLRERLQRILTRLTEAGYDARPLIFAPPAAELEILDLEADLRIALPSSLRHVLCSISANVEFRWFAPNQHPFPQPFRSNFSGDIHWSLGMLRQFNQDKQGRIDAVFKNPTDPYDRVWHNKLAFYEVGNGDYIALDLAPERHGQVVYLSHDDGLGHGHVMADSFADLLRRWTPLACPGGEDWQWLPFTSAEHPNIDPECQNARIWRGLLQLESIGGTP